MLLIVPLAVASGCATGDAARPAQDEALRAELRVVRMQNERLEQRVARLEDQVSVAKAFAQAPSSKAAAKQEPSAQAVPELAVVKLQPSRPRVDVRTPVEEPDEDSVTELLAAAKDAHAADGTSQDEDPPPDAIELEFEQGLEALRTGRISGGIERLETFALAYPEHPRADNALLLAGIGLQAQGELTGAVRLYDQAVQRYPAGDARMEAMLRLADCQLRLNQKADARALYARIISSYPGTTAASQAEVKLAKLTQN